MKTSPRPSWRSWICCQIDVQIQISQLDVAVPPQWSRMSLPKSKPISWMQAMTWMQPRTSPAVAAPCLLTWVGRLRAWGGAGRTRPGVDGHDWSVRTRHDGGRGSWSGEVGVACLLEGEAGIEPWPLALALKKQKNHRTATRCSPDTKQKHVPVHFLFHSNSRLLKNPTQASADGSLQPTTRVREHYISHTPRMQTSHNQKTVSVTLTEMVSLKLILFFNTTFRCRIRAIGCYFWREQGSSALQMHPWSPGRNLQQTAKMRPVLKF